MYLQFQKVNKSYRSIFLFEFIFAQKFAINSIRIFFVFHAGFRGLTFIFSTECCFECLDFGVRIGLKYFIRYIPKNSAASRGNELRTNDTIIQVRDIIYYIRHSIYKIIL